MDNQFKISLNCGLLKTFLSDLQVVDIRCKCSPVDIFNIEYQQGTVQITPNWIRFMVVGEHKQVFLHLKLLSTEFKSYYHSPFYNNVLIINDICKPKLCRPHSTNSTKQNRPYFMFWTDPFGRG